MYGMHAGYRASGTDTRVELADCSTSSDLRGCEASAKGVMHAVNVAISGSTQEGVVVFSQADFTNCRIRDSGLQVLHRECLTSHQFSAIVCLEAERKRI